MNYIECNGTRISWTNDRKVPDGWVLVKGEIPGPPEIKNQASAKDILDLIIGAKDLEDMKKKALEYVSR